MQIYLVSVGNRMPHWVESGFQEYAKRLPKACELILKEVVPGRRTKSCDLARLVREEGERVQAAIPPDCHVVTLDLAGRSWNTDQLSRSLAAWQGGGRNVALLVGGPDGLAEACRLRADECWSLSPLTFPHPLVRIIVAEQIYRAWTILHHHPYHK